MTASTRDELEKPWKIDNDLLTINVISKQTLLEMETNCPDQQVTNIIITCDIPAIEMQSLINLLRKQSRLKSIHLNKHNNKNNILLLNNLFAPYNLPIFDELIAHALDKSITFDPLHIEPNTDERVLGINLTPDKIQSFAESILQQFVPSNLISATFNRVSDRGCSAIVDYPYQSLVPYLNKLAQQYPHHFQSVDPENIAFLKPHLYSFIANLLKDEISFSDEVDLNYCLRAWYAKSIAKTPTERVFRLIETYLKFVDIHTDAILLNFSNNEDEKILGSEFRKLFLILDRRVGGLLHFMSNKITPANSIDYLSLFLKVLTLKAQCHAKVHAEAPYADGDPNSLPEELLASIKYFTGIGDFLAAQTSATRDHLLSRYNEWDKHGHLLSLINTLDGEEKASTDLIIYLIEIIFPRSSMLLEKFQATTHAHFRFLITAAKRYFEMLETQNFTATYARKYISESAKSEINFSYLYLSIDTTFIHCISLLANSNNAVKILHELFSHQTYDTDFFMFKLNELKIEISRTDTVFIRTIYDLLQILFQYADYIKHYSPARDTWENHKIPYFLAFLGLDKNFDIQNLRAFTPKPPQRVDSLFAMTLPIAAIEAANENPMKIQIAQQKLAEAQQQYNQLKQKHKKLNAAHSAAVAKHEELKKRKRTLSSFFNPSPTDDKMIPEAKRQKLNENSDSGNNTKQPSKANPY